MIKAVIFDYGGVMKESSQFFVDMVKIFDMSDKEIIKDIDYENKD